MENFSEERKKSCCFSGHRNLSKEELEKAASEIAELIPRLIERGINVFYAGGAIGFDLAAAVTVLNYKMVYPEISLVLAIPCRGHMNKWTRAEKQLFERVKARSDEAVYVSEEYSRGCMQKRNRYMVDRSALCICYLSIPKGGTYNTVVYAQKSGIEIINLSDGYRGEQVGFDY